eukprot:TRINITY_DN6541_c0_g1_i1.p1 TRINITY_DN6541_c0_g1~~TRINITY_DN6541_c0_g1_i1.p1  ORF type:complete len:621 (+),score=187.85 TRINITY_DN6541_c0_g1_i1:88-1863(+)
MARARALCLVALASACKGHLTMVCSSTSPGALVRPTIWLGTYHAPPATPGASGEVRVQRGDGVVVRGTFDGHCAVSLPGTADVAAVAAELGAKCAGRRDARGRELFPAGSELTCYEADPTYDPVAVARGVTEGTGTGASGVTSRLNINCNDQASDDGTQQPHEATIMAFYGAVLENVPPGRVRVWTENLVNDLRASAKESSGTPCAMARTTPYYLDMPVADGGAACTSDPPVLAFADASTMDPCRPTPTRPVTSGFVCGMLCQRGTRKVGQVMCRNGAWAAYECAANPLCPAPAVGGPAAAAVPGGIVGSEIVAVYGEGCGADGGFTKAGRACAYTCSTDFPADAASRAPTTWMNPATFPDVLAPRGSAIECQRDGTWAPAGGGQFCGCQGPPCDYESPPPPPPKVEYCRIMGGRRQSLFCWEGAPMNPWGWWAFLLLLLPMCCLAFTAAQARRVKEGAHAAPLPPSVEYANAAHAPPDTPAPVAILHDQVNVNVSPAPALPPAKHLPPQLHPGYQPPSVYAASPYAPASPDVSVLSVPRHNRPAASVGVAAFNQPLLSAASASPSPGPRGGSEAPAGIYVSVGQPRAGSL